MNHNFTPLQTNASVCAVCRFDIIAHTDSATCQCCSNIGSVNVLYGNTLMCEECEARDKAITSTTANPAAIDIHTKGMNEFLKVAETIDQSAKISTDLFNASTIAIEDMRIAIDSDVAITNKPFALAESLTKRFEHFSNLIFELNQKQLEYHSEQKAIQTYLNNLANKLRKEEREKLKISDINYQPKPVGNVKLPKVANAKPRATKVDKKELAKFAAELGVSTFTLQMICTAKGITPMQAAEELKKNIVAAAKG